METLITQFDKNQQHHDINQIQLQQEKIDKKNY